MVLALPVHHPKRHDTVLLKADMELDDQLIERLREINCREVWVRYPKLGFISQYINPAVNEARANVTGMLADDFDRIAGDTHARLDYDGYRRAIGSMIEKIYEHPKAALYIQELIDSDRPELTHASSVCLLSVLMGLKLEFYLVNERKRLAASNARDVTNLGLGALLHDIGMTQLQPEVVARWRAHHDETDVEWRRHVLEGYDMVRGEVDPSAAAAVLHHHQKFDGSGFPKLRASEQEERSFEGSDIHVFARIVAAADLFDRLRQTHADENAQPAPAVRALRIMREPPFSAGLDPVIFQGLLSVVPPYPPGAMVKLSNGVSGVVTEWYPSDPCRPRVVELTGLDPETDEPTGAGYNLLFRRDLEVIAIDGHDVRGDNFYPNRIGEFDLELTSKRMINAAHGHKADRLREDEPAA